jgi:hypothetical protein
MAGVGGGPRLSARSSWERRHPAERRGGGRSRRCSAQAIPPPGCAPVAALGWKQLEASDTITLPRRFVGAAVVVALLPVLGFGMAYLYERGYAHALGIDPRSVAKAGRTSSPRWRPDLRQPTRSATHCPIPMTRLARSVFQPDAHSGIPDRGSDSVSDSDVRFGASRGVSVREATRLSGRPGGRARAGASRRATRLRASQGGTRSRASRVVATAPGG